MKFFPFPELKTERLLLRQLSCADEEAIFFLRSDEKVNKYIDRPRPRDREQAMAFITDINHKIEEGTSIYWAISLKESSKAIGAICLWNFSADKKVAELGYELGPVFQGQGLMNEAVGCVMKYAFEQLGLTTIEAFTHKNNSSSIRLLEKRGFTLIPGRLDEGNPSNLVFQIAASA
jgi:[ribosomal protein S5]-alanine N-acetyltransferase